MQRPTSDLLDSVSLGYGFDTFAAEVRAAALKTTDKYTNNQAASSVSKLDTITTYEQLVKTLDISVDVSASFFGGSDHFRYLDESEYTSYDLYAIAYIKIRLPSQNLRGGDLIHPADAQALSRKDFSLKYGDKYVSEIDIGGDLFGLLHVHCEVTIRAKHRPDRPYVVTGHSLGAALSTLFVIENKEKQKFDIATSCTFASPRVGNVQFGIAFNELPITSGRIVNSYDIVPRLPFRIPGILDFEHGNTEYRYSSGGEVKFSPVCWHEMQTYLHLLDPEQPLDATCAVPLEPAQGM